MTEVYHYRIKPKYANLEYPWPCPGNKSRTVEVYENDIFTKNERGFYDMHTGLMKLNIRIPDDHMERHEGWPNLVML